VVDEVVEEEGDGIEKDSMLLFLMKALWRRVL
jgi:hypothetical protein